MNTFFNKLPSDEIEWIINNNLLNVVCGFTEVCSNEVHINLPLVQARGQSIENVLKHEVLHGVIVQEYGGHPEWVVEAMLND